MRYGSGLGQNGVATPVQPEVRVPPTAIATVKEIPYDYVATFKLNGDPGRRIQDVISISAEGAFVATSIGYSFIPARISATNRDLSKGFFDKLALSSTSTHQALYHCLLARLCGIDFKYSIVDSGSGRELQNRAIHNVAGLGKADGDRPFHPLAKPMLFMPRSTVRIEVEEVSVGDIYGYIDATNRQEQSELFIVFHGYKILGYGAGTP